MKYLTATILLLFFCLAPASAQNWTIEVEPEGFTGDKLLLAYYLGNAQYVKDTAAASDGVFRFSGVDTLHSGVYMVIFPPDNQYFQLLVGESEHDIKIDVGMDQVTRPHNIRGSEESKRFYEYVDFLQKQRPYAEQLRARMDSMADPDAKAAIGEELNAVNASVREYQHDLRKKHPNSLTALLVSAGMDVELPEFEGTEEDVQMQTFRYIRAHYFDHIPMRDPRLVRTPVLHQKIEYFLTKLTHQVPDSLSLSIDAILSRFDRDSEAFRVYLVHFLNTYAKSNIVGMDAVYVHIADKYYGRGLATWTDEETLQKILKNAETLRPLLIGRTAPDLLMYNRDNQAVRLHDVDAAYVVMFFWDPECGHCKKSIPDIKLFYETYHPKGIEIFAVCTSLQDEVAKCWETVDERGMGDWLHVVDPYLRSRFKQIYDIRTTPQIYILDKDKKIVMKKIGAEKLPEVLDLLMQSGS